MIYEILVKLFKCSRVDTPYGSWMQTAKRHDWAVSLPQGIVSGTTLTPKSYKHEVGHHEQYLKYGWRWWYKVAIPSFFGNIYSRIAKKDSAWYYNQPWEHEADVLGGVER